MSNEATPPLRRIAWHDLTVDDAGRMRDFYAEVVGWKPQGLSMGDYDDYCMNDPVTGETVAGVCHARGDNSKAPPQWLIYITVPSVAAAMAKCEALGGQIVDGPRNVGGKAFCIIRDPAGAVAALIEP